jgi:hypothetical protein
MAGPQLPKLKTELEPIFPDFLVRNFSIFAGLKLVVVPLLSIA